MPMGPEIKPWTALGVKQGKGTEQIYCFESAGQIHELRQTLITSPATMLLLDPDADRWRMMFPHPKSAAKFDHLKAAGFLMRECWAAQARRNRTAGSDAPGTETVPNTPKHRGNTSAKG